MNVYDATQERLKYIFENFDNVYVAFSGGKDSGLLLNLVIKYIRENNIDKRIGVFHLDFEGQYTLTTEYVERTLSSNLDIIKPYWVCIPMACKTATSSFEQYWYPWDEDKKELWVRDMPDNEHVINIHNHSFDFYYDGITQDEIYSKFIHWYHSTVCGNQGRTACLVGIRSQESLNRFRAIVQDKETYDNKKWTTKEGNNLYSVYPIYDWKTEDVWIAHERFKFDYNKIYDMFYKAGLTIHQMRVASPFNDWAIGTLNLYRVIEPSMWVKLLGRVQGANFSNIYGGTKAVGWKHVDLPEGHTWKSYVSFLLSTLPKSTRETYLKKFNTSIKFWKDTGGVLSDETIGELERENIPHTVLDTKSNYKTEKKMVKFDIYPDDANVKDFMSVPSYKRMAICILKNDHLCKTMGFSLSKADKQRRDESIRRYQTVND